MKCELFTTFDEAEIGRKLGYDLFQFGRSEMNPQWPTNVAEGFLHARANGIHSQSADRFERKWLQLRLNAYQRGRLVDEQVTPDLLRKIDVTQCPVLRISLTHGEQKSSDWSIDRLNNDGAYAPYNLAVISVLANQAKGNKSFEEVYALSRSAKAAEGLTPEQWLRMAVLMLGPCFAARPQSAPTIPLTTPIPSLTTILGMQQVQYVFTKRARLSSGKNALIKYFGYASRDQLFRLRLKALAEKVHIELKGVDCLWDVWLRPGVMEALHEWRNCMNAVTLGAVGEISRQLAGATHVQKDKLNLWWLRTHGYLS